MWFGVYFRGFWIGWFKTKAAGHFDGAENDLQDMQRPAGLKSVGMGGNSPHGMKTDRATDHFGMGVPAKICPFLIKLDGLVKGNSGDFCGDTANFICLNSNPFRDGIR